MAVFSLRKNPWTTRTEKVEKRGTLKGSDLAETRYGRDTPSWELTARLLVH